MSENTPPPVGTHLRYYTGTENRGGLVIKIPAVPFVGTVEAVNDCQSVRLRVRDHSGQEFIRPSVFVRAPGIFDGHGAEQCEFATWDALAAELAAAVEGLGQPYTGAGAPATAEAEGDTLVPA